ncbi:hypothetical protein QE152_g24969 [Popillia japonica]|uniref:Endonuclease/exonuclease/phosphatase domain-containing protein n=1 Tax=Popillia japonica TaxID=7064 RepID=A0AAW1K1N9_POPJA
MLHTELFFVSTGDLNINMLHTEHANTSALCSLLNDYCLLQIVNDPTRVSSHCVSLIDLIICSEALPVLRSGTVDASDFSDHHLVFCDIEMERIPVPAPSSYHRNFSNFNHDNFLADLQQIP